MISFSSINKQYGKQLLFVDASFQLNPGEKVGLVGPNGAGKTTLFRMVVGEETPDDGTDGCQAPAHASGNSLGVTAASTLCILRLPLRLHLNAGDT